VNLYSYVGNDAQDRLDFLGLAVMVPNPRDPLGKILALCKIPCDQLRQFIADLAQELGKRYKDGLADKNDLWSTTQDGPRPDKPGTWDGHREQFNNQKGRLQRAIDEYNDRCGGGGGGKLPQSTLEFPARPNNWEEQLQRRFKEQYYGSPGKMSPFNIPAL
jgi:hypothetical protein